MRWCRTLEQPDLHAGEPLTAAFGGLPRVLAASLVAGPDGRSALLERRTHRLLRRRAQRASTLGWSWPSGAPGFACLRVHVDAEPVRWVMCDGYVEAWRQLIDQGLEAALAAATDPGERGNAMRQASPFTGILDHRERWALLRGRQAE